MQRKDTHQYAHFLILLIMNNKSMASMSLDDLEHVRDYERRQRGSLKSANDISDPNLNEPESRL
jgi:hypothetical protein